MNNTITEVYADNGGGLDIYLIDADNGVMWSMCYYGDGSSDYGSWEMAAADFIAIEIQCLDPIAEGWDNADLDYDSENGSLIASSNWYSGSYESMFDLADDGEYFGHAAHEFFVAAGVIGDED